MGAGKPLPRARARVTRGHEFSLWFVGLCWIVSIFVDGGLGALMIVD